MWFIFPQLRGLGKSSMAYLYGISGLEEVETYLSHPVLSARLYEICDALLEHRGTPAYVIFGDIDAMKLKSSMTLFAIASEEPSVFHQVLDSFFDGEKDEATLKLLGYWQISLIMLQYKQSSPLASFWCLLRHVKSVGWRTLFIFYHVSSPRWKARVIYLLNYLERMYFALCYSFYIITNDKEEILWKTQKKTLIKPLNY